MNPTSSPSPRESEVPAERIRERAYFLWLEHGCPEGENLDHWLAAEREFFAVGPAAANEPPSTFGEPPSLFSIKKTVAAHLSDPTHRFHATGAVHDNRVDVIAGEARQRVRGRHFGGSLRATPKKPE
jgi:hypothetical protein